MGGSWGIHERWNESTTRIDIVTHDVIVMSRVGSWQLRYFVSQAVRDGEAMGLHEALHGARRWG